VKAIFDQTVSPPQKPFKRHYPLRHQSYNTFLSLHTIAPKSAGLCVQGAGLIVLWSLKNRTLNAIQRL
jgi:hypothetical protein